MKIRALLPMLLVAMVLLSACEKDITLNLKGTPPVLVVNGWVTNKPMANLAAQTGNLGYLLQPGANGPITYKSCFVVKLTTTASYYSSDSTPAVSGALVLISGSDNPTRKDTLKENPKFSGIYLGDSTTVGKVGVTYSLFIQANGQVYTAQDQLDSIAKIDSAQVTVNTGKRTGYRVTYYTRNVVGVDSYYLFNYYRNDTLINSPTTIYADEALASIINPDDPELSQESPFLYQSGNTSYVEIFSLSKTLFTYYSQLAQQLSTSGPGGGFAVVFGTIPANVQGNISNGAQGFFQASMYYTYYQTIP